MPTLEAATKIKVAHSPDADDQLMFWPIKEGLVKTDNFIFSFTEADTASLNNIALNSEADICAISAVHYAKVFNNYQPMLTGASVGNGYGPVLIGHASVIDTSDTILLIPGRTTTAYCALEILGYKFATIKEISIFPMQLIFDELNTLHANGKKAVALLIHEGRLIYQQLGYQLLLDIGVEWQKKFHSSLPLGINVISRKLSLSTRIKLNKIIKNSCEFAINNTQKYIEKAILLKQTNLSAEQMQQYFELYANQSTLSMNDHEINSFYALLQKARELNIQTTYPPINVDWL